MGLFQLTRLEDNRRPNSNEMWNWKTNCDKGVDWLRVKWDSAYSWMYKPGGQRDQANQLPVPDHIVGNILFSENTSITIEDAIALKLYNGASTNYCYWDNSTDQWMFHVWGYWYHQNGDKDSTNYVEEICIQVQ